MVDVIKVWVHRPADGGVLFPTFREAVEDLKAGGFRRAGVPRRIYVSADGTVNGFEVWCEGVGGERAIMYYEALAAA